MKPQAILVAGPNGAGKTTYARQFVPVLHPGVPYLNADEIHRESGQFDSEISAAREFLRRLEAHERARTDFALETTLSSLLYARRIPAWQSSGYEVVLHFIELPSADIAVQRVLQRVAAGGHDIPEATIRRRFARGHTLFQNPYKGLVDAWYHWGSNTGGLHLVDQS